LIQAALDKAGTGGKEDAVLVGDTTWDIEAAKKAGVPTVAVRTGGFGRDELEEAGAVAVFDSVAELRERLGETALG
jgi:phosphoglycolate phosphatase-like HAD superfamily hydrolase